MTKPRTTTSTFSRVPKKISKETLVIVIPKTPVISEKVVEAEAEVGLGEISRVEEGVVVKWTSAALALFCSFSAIHVISTSCLGIGKYFIC